MKPATEEVSQLRSWDFTVFSRKEEDLLGLAFSMFTDFDLLDKFDIPEEKLRLDFYLYFVFTKKKFINLIIFKKEISYWQ